MLLGDILDFGAGAFFVLVQSNKVAAVFNAEAERPGTAEKRELVRIAFTECAIAVRAAKRLHKPDILVVSDRLGWEARKGGDISNIHDQVLLIQRRQG